LGIGYGEGRVWVSTKDGLTWINPRTGQVGPSAAITTPQYVAVGAGAAWTEDQLGTVYKVGLNGRVLATYRTADGGVGDTAWTTSPAPPAWTATRSAPCSSPPGSAPLPGTR
jgi:hypothetical protein